MNLKNLINPSFLSFYSLNKGIASQSVHIYGKVLDVGCGNKPYRRYFTCNEYIGLDTHNSGHNHINTEADIYYDGIHFPFQDNSFDCIVCFQVMEHVVDFNQFLNEIKRVLKPGGLILATAPFMWAEHEKPYDFRRWTSYGFKSSFIEKNFQIISHVKSGTSIIVLISFINDLLRSQHQNFLIKYLFYFIYFLQNSFCYILLKFNLLKIDNPKSDFFLDNIIVAKNIL